MNAFKQLEINAKERERLLKGIEERMFTFEQADTIITLMHLVNQDYTKAEKI